MDSAIVCLVAVVLDLWLGEPRQAHPLALFHRWVDRVDTRLAGLGAGWWRGSLAVGLFAGLPALAAAGLTRLPSIDLLAAVLLLYLTLGTSGLVQQARTAAAAIAAGEPVDARRAVAWLVGRDPGPQSPADALDATLGAVLAGGNRAAFAPLFWFVVAGVPGALFYRLNNTLAATWVNSSARFGRFGAPARVVDRLMEAVPARLAAVTYGLLGDGGGCLRGWRSPGVRGGPAVARAAGAGALGLRLDDGSGVADGRPAAAADVERAARLVRNGVWLWVAVVIAGELFLG